MIKACSLMNKFEKKYSWGSVFGLYMALLKVANHRGSVIFPASQWLFSLRSKTQPHLLYVTFFFLLLLWNSDFLYESAVVSLAIRYDSFWYAVAFTEQQRCLFDKCCFLLTQYCGHKRIRIFFYWIAGGVYWSAVTFTNPLVTITGLRCRLLIRDVVYKSAV